MILSRRRKPLARTLLLGLTSVMAGGHALDVLAQTSVPLRVDPALLGLPPLRRGDVSTTAPSKPLTVEVMPVIVPDVERKSVDASERNRAGDKASASARKDVAPATPAAPSASVTASPRVDPSLLGAAPARAVPTPVGAVPVPDAASAPPSVAAAQKPVGPTSLARKKTEDGRSWSERLWAPLATAYREGAYEVMLPFETYHLRSAYSAEKIATYQEKPKGLGIGKGYYNAKGDWEGVYAMAFQDSHFKPMYMAGYGWQSIWRPAEDLRLGLGYVAGLMARTDIMHYKPFPLIVPAGSISYGNFSLHGAFIPGGAGWGNVAFFWAKWEMGKNGELVRAPAPVVPEEETVVADTAMSPVFSPVRQRVPFGPALAVSQGAPVVAGGVSAGGGASVSGGSGQASVGELMPSRVAPVAEVHMDGEVSVADETPSLTLKMSRMMTLPPKESEAPRPVFLNALRMGGEVDREFNAEGEAELRKVGIVLNADQLTYWPIEDEVQAEGNVRLEQDGSVVTGPKVRLRLEDQIGYFNQPVYLFRNKPKAGSQQAANNAFAEQFLENQRRNDYWNSGFAAPRTTDLNIYSAPNRGRTMSDVSGEAERIDFEGENHYRLFSNTFSTCTPGDNGWYMRSKEMELDYDTERGTGKSSTIYFKDTPIFYSPWLPFSLNRQRKSGLLAPTFGSSTTNGLSLSVPYYWDIAPNMDATITTREMMKRGLQLNTDFRYLNTGLGGMYSGEARVELLPGDKTKNGDSRYGMTFAHRQITSNGFSALVNYNKVSDNTYFTDLSSYITQTSQSQLMQQAVVSYGGGGWWNATANFQQYQTLQPDSASTVVAPYRMLPQLTLNARKPDLYGTDSIFMGQYTAFSKAQQVINGVTTTDPNGQRLVLYPQVALPMVHPGWYITPKVGMNIRHYTLTNQAAGVPSSINTTVPTASLDTGMTFERSSRWFGKDYTQTLEPRLYYVNIPYRNQDNIPLFDSSLADFNFAQIFSENQFSGWDRINNANQLTAAATSRLLDPNTGAELVRFMLGQRFYFARNRVALGTSSTTTDDQNWDKSDFLTAFSGQILPKVYTDVAMQYNYSDQKFKRQSFGVRYLPEAGKVLNAAYRYNADTSAPTNQIDLSAQWPLTGKLYGVGRYNYSFKDTSTTTSTTSQTGRLVQAVAGMEYRGGCWVLRGVIQRTALTSSTVSSAIFVQLELNDFASIGSNPISILRRNIQGYSLINEPSNDFDYVQ